MEDENTMTMLYKVTDGAVEDKNYGAHMIAPILLSLLFCLVPRHFVGYTHMTGI